MKEERTIRLDEINVLSVVKDLLLNAWVILLVVISAWLGVSSYSKLTYVPEYTSTATIVVSAKGNSGAYTSLNLTMQMAEVFAEVFQSDILKAKVEDQLGVSELDGRISTAVIPETNLMTISVTSSGPEEAFRTLNLILENYPQISDYLFGNAVLEVIKEPAVPISPSNSPQTGRYKKMALLVGFAVPVIIIVWLSITRDTIQTPQAAKRKLDGKQLGTISHEEKNKTITAKRKKKNIAALITNPLVSFSYMEAYQNLCSRLDYHMRHHKQKILLVGSAQENEGKSTVAANLALALAARNRKVLLLDCDFRKPAIQKIFEVKTKKEDDFGHYLSTDDTKGGMLVFVKKYGLYLGVNQVSYKTTQKLITSDKLKFFLEKQKEEMDYIILDSPPMLVASDTEALAHLADNSLLVVRQDRTTARDINDCMDLLSQATAEFSGYVLNDFREFSLLKKLRA